VNDSVREWPVSIKVTGYKCFGDEPVGFDKIKPINLIVGRNNSGKSALIDVIQEASKDKPSLPARSGRQAQNPVMHLSAPLTEAVFEAIDSSIRSRAVAGYKGRAVSWTQPNNDVRHLQTFNPSSQGLGLGNPVQQAEIEKQMMNQIKLPMASTEFRRIAAERDMKPEPEVNGDLTVKSDGGGVTNLIREIYTGDGHDRDIVTVKLLKALNEIVAPDYEFTEILVRKASQVNWEVELKEAAKGGSIPVSRSGSGIKTVLIVLCNILVLPEHYQKKLESYTFAFEELENSLHPALQRRLISYVTRSLLEHNSIAFFTTHSSVSIDMLQSNPASQILHLQSDAAGKSVLNVVNTYERGRAILDDLEVRASDLLQSNGVIWVEGPSDRIYITRWIEMRTDGKLKEGTHYQIVFYGGSLLAHLTAEAPDAADSSKLAVLRINRNAALVMDSDRSVEGGKISDTKQRIIDEMAEINGYTWLTQGREIENYVPSSVIAKVFGLASEPVLEKFSDIQVVLNATQQGLGAKFEKSKAAYAALFMEHVNVETQKSRLDWLQQMDELTKRIYGWNGCFAVVAP
jgi:putative ATP-dependent endonuclease of OLD family